MSTILSRIPVVGGLAYAEAVLSLPATFDAALTVEPDNRYFRHAIAVSVDGRKVGYVAPEIARRLRRDREGRRRAGRRRRPPRVGRRP